MSDHDDELVALRRQRQALAAERLERAAARELELARRAERDALADELREKALEEALVAAEAQHGALGAQLAVVHAKYANGQAFGSIIVRRPDPMMWSRFRNKFGDAKGVERDQLMEQLVRPHVVWAGRPPLDQILSELPHTLVRLSDAIAVLAGVSAEEVAGKS